MSSPTPPDRCTTEGHCITCSDEGVPMRVATLDEDAGLATCVDADGAATEVMTALVESVRVGDLLLVHAGTALLRLDPDPAAAPDPDPAPDPDADPGHAPLAPVPDREVSP